MTTFKLNEIYKCGSLCNQDCVWTYKVIKRTPSTVTLMDVRSKDVRTCRINKKWSEWCGCETVLPQGKFSMCPSLRADRVF